MEPQNDQERTSTVREIKDSFSGPGFALGAVAGVFALWALGQISGMEGETLKIFYRNSYTVFFGISSFLYYKKIKP
ncbi:MAG: hypothetical protein ACYDFU_07825 [Nitrospirota bacterium]